MPELASNNVIKTAGDVVDEAASMVVSVCVNSIGLSVAGPIAVVSLRSRI